MSYETCLAAISADPLNHSRTTPPLFFRESTASSELRQVIYRLTGHTSFIKYMKSIHPTIKWYGVLLRETGEIVRGTYWSELLEDEEALYYLE